MEPECKVRLRVFEGPLDLLLHLINKNKLDIADIPISLVTNQYLEYLALLEALNIEVAAEYLVMAATLMHIKSRMLLPRERDNLANDDDPRMELTKALEELKKAQDYATILDMQPVLFRDVFPRGENPLELNEQDEPSGPLEVNLIELIDALCRVLRDNRIPKPLEIEQARVDVGQRISQIEHFLDTVEQTSFFSLIEGEKSRPFVIATFLAILELAKSGKIRLFQDQHGGDITIAKRKVAIH